MAHDVPHRERRKAENGIVQAAFGHDGFGFGFGFEVSTELPAPTELSRTTRINATTLGRIHQILGGINIAGFVGVTLAEKRLRMVPMSCITVVQFAWPYRGLERPLNRARRLAGVVFYLVRFWGGNGDEIGCLRLWH